MAWGGDASGTGTPIPAAGLGPGVTAQGRPCCRHSIRSWRETRWIYLSIPISCAANECGTAVLALPPGVAGTMGTDTGSGSALRLGQLRHTGMVSGSEGRGK